MVIMHIALAPTSELNGGAFVMGRNRRLLKSIYGAENVITVDLPKTSMKTVGLSLLTMSSYGVPLFLERKIISKINKNNVELVFIEGSLLGNLVKHLSKTVRTVIYAHNVETELYRQRYKKENGFISWLRYKFVSFNEKTAIKYANKIITLNKRDSDLMYKIYGRTSDIELPITYPFRAIVNKKTDKQCNPYCLFVGSDFFPNIEGILWFINNVVPYISMEIHVVGACCNNTALKNISITNVKLLGYVNDIEEEYLNASAVIIPIFSGSGMKTKTIEALSYGKAILGTKEAFEGIDCDIPEIGYLCKTPDDFISKINQLLTLKPHTNSFRIFSEKYNDTVFLKELNKFLLELKS